MKRNGTNKLIFGLLLSLFIASCQPGGGNHGANHHEAEHTGRLYTCPMHPDIVKNQPGTCPICGMTLVPQHVPGTETSIDSSLQHLLKPVNEQVVSDIATIRVITGMQITSVPVQGIINYDLRNKRSISSRVSGRIEKLYIRYNYQPVKKGQLIMEVYSADLAAAQRELLFLSKQQNNYGLLTKAKERLMLLGLTEKNIRSVIESGEIMYRIPVYSSSDGLIIETASVYDNDNTPSPAGMLNQNDMTGMATPQLKTNKINTDNSNNPIMLREGQYVNAGNSMFTVIDNRQLIAEFYFTPDIASHIHEKQSILFNTVDNPGKMYNGSIGLVQPVFNNEVPFSIARAYLPHTDLAPGQLITGNIPLVSTGKWIPQQAIYHTGNQAIVFKKENNVFVPKYVKTGTTSGNMTEVLDSIDNWILATNAAYLVDSESYIKAAKNNSN
ncbi:MAG: efflux RND transporter periplasmic adaptor subunit [Chitinophagaceae bacterium]|nr:efflux RND transporter periplasmic adaptor subunit [Chitinophagaceae bacterium]